MFDLCLRNNIKFNDIEMNYKTSFDLNLELIVMKFER